MVKKTDGEMHDNICYEAEGFKTENPDDFSAFQQCFFTCPDESTYSNEFANWCPLSPK